MEAEAEGGGGGGGEEGDISRCAFHLMQLLPNANDKFPSQSHPLRSHLQQQRRKKCVCHTTKLSQMRE